MCSVASVFFLLGSRRETLLGVRRVDINGKEGENDFDYLSDERVYVHIPCLSVITLKMTVFGGPGFSLLHAPRTCERK